VTLFIYLHSLLFPRNSSGPHNYRAILMSSNDLMTSFIVIYDRYFFHQLHIMSWSHKHLGLRVQKVLTFVFSVTDLLFVLNNLDLFLDLSSYRLCGCWRELEGFDLGDEIAFFDVDDVYF
jgi:hypothetical protein